MTSPKNIQRDGTWIDPKGTLQSWSTPTILAGTTCKMSGPAAIQIDEVSVQADYPNTETVAAGFIHCIGSYWVQPQVDNHPFRIKASVLTVGILDCIGLIVIGDGPAAPTGTDDTVVTPQYIPFKNTFDDLILINPFPVTTNSLVIGLAIVSTSGFTGTIMAAQLSVQNLGTKPPTMQNAVS